MVNIIQKNNNILRQKAKNIPLKEIGSKKIKGIITDMKEALLSQADGVAIAAPQISIPLRIFVISRKVKLWLKGVENITEADLAKTEDLVYINPEIIKLSKKTQILDEGCLSVRPYFGKVKRAEKATITAYDENGKSFTQGGSGLLAQIFQHETDHLNGVLFIDKATDLKEVLPENNDK